MKLDFEGLEEVRQYAADSLNANPGLKAIGEAAEQAGRSRPEVLDALIRASLNCEDGRTIEDGFRAELDKLKP